MLLCPVIKPDQHFNTSRSQVRYDRNVADTPLKQASQIVGHYSSSTVKHCHYLTDLIQPTLQHQTQHGVCDRRYVT